MFRHTSLFPLFLFACLVPCSCGDASSGPAGADYVTPRWQTLRLEFTGPATSEMAEENPFTTMRLDVVFKHRDTQLVVPGFYAADGNAAETSAEGGDVWRVNFNPSLEGDWNYVSYFRRGDDVMERDYLDLTQDVAGLTTTNGRIFVGPPVAGERGRLARTHPRYLQWQQSGEYFLKAGAGSPENLLAYADFDGTYRHSDQFRDGESKADKLHSYPDHVADAPAGAPTWQAGKGKGLLGALQYLHDAGANSVYFLTMNINGDGKDVWPFLKHGIFDRFDVSKLAQWERVFTFADDLGMHLHFVLQETENESLLDGGDTGPLRQLYFREMIARFGHHRALTWDLGEENGPNDWSENPQDNAQQLAMAKFFEEYDPYHNHTVFHTHPHPGDIYKIYDPLLGKASIDGLALQLDPEHVHATTVRLIRSSQEAGQPWLLTQDEIGPWWRGLDPDAGYTRDSTLNNQDSLRALVLWGNLMAGGAGAEWYFGAHSATNALNTESFRGYNAAWAWGKTAVDFFHAHVPFAAMASNDQLVSGEATCLASAGTYLVNLPFGEPTTLDLTAATGKFEISWFNPEAGGDLLTYEPKFAAGGSTLQLAPPSSQHWVALIRR